MTMQGDHWRRAYRTRPPTELGWYERVPAVSLRLIEIFAPQPARSTALIDVGGGASRLVDTLLERGFEDVTVLDVAAEALAQVRARLGDTRGAVRLIEHDVLSWTPDRDYDMWHDRALFHFLVQAADRARYVEIATQTVRPEGVLILGTFADDGPDHCSGLPVVRYAARDLASGFEGFSLVWDERDDHVTPGGVVQPFTWAVLRRSAESS
jgi:SAM-dependent methyltransferase